MFCSFSEMVLDFYDLHVLPTVKPKWLVFVRFCEIISLMKCPCNTCLHVCVFVCVSMCAYISVCVYLCVFVCLQVSVTLC